MLTLLKYVSFTFKFGCWCGEKPCPAGMRRHQQWGNQSWRKAGEGRGVLGALQGLAVVGSRGPGPLCFSPAPQKKQRELSGGRPKDQLDSAVSKGLCLFTDALILRNNISLLRGMGYFGVFCVPMGHFSCSSSVGEAGCLAEQGQRNAVTAFFVGCGKEVLQQNQ